jgi:hypothetical protein
MLKRKTPAALEHGTSELFKKYIKRPGQIFPPRPSFDAFRFAKFFLRRR